MRDRLLGLFLEKAEGGGVDPEAPPFCNTEIRWDQMKIVGDEIAYVGSKGKYG